MKWLQHWLHKHEMCREVNLQMTLQVILDTWLSTTQSRSSHLRSVINCSLWSNNSNCRLQFMHKYLHTSVTDTVSTCRCAPLRCATKRNVRQMIFLASGSKSYLQHPPIQISNLNNPLSLFPPNLSLKIQCGTGSDSQSRDSGCGPMLYHEGKG